ncbi:antibiotic biosynthesis monooxygenase [Kutzneria sp. CA-103260]|uniref:antibiotic biosynthesis monooxygenase n=1 Tax=Kutzneria sp. CA-103260 TaxID=2802641 RepID=UPI001BA66291|nr:antibiotic biosynthesis monooxygenase [Kutzneria sp. CA-103260]QUQ67981.1 Antibiotic biosynthesis monooxygenase [Kutzneria sp. CA-103260]
MLLVCRFEVPEAEAAEFTATARHALELLTAQPGCRTGRLGRATDAADRWVLVVEFDSVVAYRRAMSPFPVREVVVPLLSRALADEPAAFELTVSAADGRADEHVSLLAGDAGTVRLGEAAGPAASPR